MGGGVGCEKWATQIKLEKKYVHVHPENDHFLLSFPISDLLLGIIFPCNLIS